jgi:uncharacterized membrane protein
MNKLSNPVFVPIGIVLITLFAVWLWFVPKGYFGITSAVGYTFCHQDPARSPHAFGHTLALCYRCMGLFTGIFIGALWQLGERRHARFNSASILTFAIPALYFYAFDGLNASFLPKLLSVEPLYQDQPWIRMLSGLLLGNAVALLVIPLFNRVFYQDFVHDAPVQGILRKTGIAVFDALLLFVFQRGMDVGMVLANTAAILTAIGIVTLLYSILSTVILKQNNQFHTLREGWQVFLLGGLITMMQIGGITWLRYAVTGTWGWPFTGTGAPDLFFDSIGL